jgi:hypothetical protein
MYQYYTSQEIQMSRQEAQFSEPLLAEPEEDLGAFCDAMDPVDDIVRSVFTNCPLAVALAMLHIQSMAEKHDAGSLGQQQALEPRFASWLEGHSKKGPEVDAALVKALARTMSTQEIERAVDEYLQIIGMLDSSLEQQLMLDVDSFEKLTGETLSPKDRDELLAALRQAVRWTYLGSGMTHSGFLGVLEHLSPHARRRVEQLAPAYC